MFYVVGNGPSLTESMVKSFPSGRWLGMNAAYKFWNEIRKYPKYYACLDPVVIKSQYQGICQLLSHSPIERYFLHDAILEVAPEIAGDNRITLLSSFLNMESPVLPVSKVSEIKQTTGALATRFAIESGETKLLLIGIDCNYVGVIEEAAQGSGYELIVQKTVKSNPNYFFDDYQQMGDKYQVPNPPVHSGNLHLQSFVCLHNDLMASGIDVSIYVGAADSLLHKYSVFPYLNYWTSMHKRRLQCVAVPLTTKEIDGFLYNVEKWLSPQLKPSLTFRKHGTTLHLFFDFKEDASVVKRLNDFVASHPEIYSYFEDVRLTFFNFPNDINYYIKNTGEAPNRFCSKSGPNIFFLSMMRHCRNYEFTMQMESDCMPMRAGWLDAADNLLDGGAEDAWTIGPGYFGPMKLDSSYRSHINGNAIYYTGSRQFQEFLRNEFLPLLQDFISGGVNDLAYDTMLSLAYANIGLLSRNRQQILLRASSKFRRSNFCLNLGGRIENSEPFAGDLRELLKENPDSYIVHGRAVVDAVHRQLSRLDLYFNSSPEVLIKELPLGYLWSSDGGLERLVYEGYGRASAAGKVKSGQASVVLHFRRLDDTNLSGKGYIFSALVSGDTDCIVAIDFLFIASGKQIYTTMGDLNRTEIDSSVRLRVTINEVNVNERASIVGVRFTLAGSPGEGREVILALSDMSCVEVHNQAKTDLKQVSVDPIKSDVYWLIDAWCQFVAKGRRRGDG